ncbi:MAG: RHS repeat-associated core domain-containing protein [Clostridiales bacterium]|nr:RHS repeat-associated core domain-containing protein [Clostridiales bacterium]
MTNYHWNDLDQLVEQDRANGTLLFYHDDKGDIGAFVFNGAKYNFRRNAQGDVTAILDLANNIVAKYTYDAWGKVLSVTDANGNAITDPNHIANVNPIRYRGYYYDTETGLYYLNSRYYDPQTGRFLNADDTDVLDEDQNSLSENNLFAYCLNNPVNMTDDDGTIAWWIAAAVGGAGVYYARSKGFTLSKAGDGISEHKNGNTWNKHTNPRAGRLKTKNRSAKKWKRNANPKRHGGKINQPKYKAYYSNHKRHHKTYYRTYHKKYKTYRYRRTYRYRTKH